VAPNQPTAEPPSIQATITAQPGATQTSIPETTASPAPNPAYPPLSVGIQAVQVSDDDGARTADITAQQVEQWINKSNEIFAKASIRFIYDPNVDFASLKSTLLNNMSGDTDPNWAGEVDFGNQVAAGYSGKLVVFFRNGPGQGQESGGFSWSDYNFVAMPGFNTSVCGYQNSGALAHEIGHYLGLSHPFPQVFASVQEAEAYLTAHGNDPQAFDGDGLSDTPPDPFINIPKFQCNPSTQSVTLNGQVFSLPRKNIMSYYSNGAKVDRTELTPQQSNIVRWVLGLRAKNGMATPTNSNVPGAVDFATLSIKDSSGVNTSVQDMSSWSQFTWNGHKQLFGNAQLNGTIRFSTSVAAAGKYQLNLYATMAPDYGKIQTLVDGKPLGAPIDLYSPIVLPSGRISIGTVDLSTGTHILSFRVVGKNAASNGYSLGLNTFTLTP